jgi:hypothetical protein
VDLGCGVWPYTHTHTHTQTHIFVCVCVFVCVYLCVCVCVWMRDSDAAYGTGKRYIHIYNLAINIIYGSVVALASCRARALLAVGHVSSRQADPNGADQTDFAHARSPALPQTGHRPPPYPRRCVCVSDLRPRYCAHTHTHTHTCTSVCNDANFGVSSCCGVPSAGCRGRTARCSDAVPSRVAVYLPV